MRACTYRRIPRGRISPRFLAVLTSTSFYFLRGNSSDRGRCSRKICRTGFVFSFFLKYRDRLGRMDSPQVHDFQLYDLLGSQPDVNLDLFSFNNPVEATDQLATSSVEHTSTPPKLSQTRSRNPRSCDFCRVRKTACIVEHALPCTTCRARGFECTFTKRRRKTRRTDLLGGSSRHSGI